MLAVELIIHDPLRDFHFFCYKSTQMLRCGSWDDEKKHLILPREIKSRATHVRIEHSWKKKFYRVDVNVASYAGI